MNIIAKSNENKLSILLFAVVQGIVVGILPYFLYANLLVLTGIVEAGGTLGTAMILLGIVLFIPTSLYSYRNNDISLLELTDKKLVYTHAKRGKKITNTIDIANIRSVDILAVPIFPGGARLVIVSKNPAESFIAGGGGTFSYKKLQPIVESLKSLPQIEQSSIANDYTVDDPKKSLKRIFLGVFVVVAIGIATMVLAVSLF